jgi:demethylmenaquinone methyltransferase/2-methoxy-6-polyprenyl-1,4-benzoquinol methylase/phosphoethanolamine N-methyltransferase
MSARFYDAGFNIFMLGRARALRQMTVALAGVAPGEMVLDAGCGTGELTMAARRAAGATGQVLGIDSSPEMIAVARRKAARAGLAIDYRVAGVEALPFPDSTFDVVVNSMMMHHLSDDLKRRAVAEMKRVLRPRGRLLIVDFRRSRGHMGHLPTRSHRHDHADTLDLSGLLKVAGFSEVEVGDTNVGFLAFTRGRVWSATGSGGG